MKTNLLLIALLVLGLKANAQSLERKSDSVLHVKYWNYRQNFLKYNIVVGEERGMSVPGSYINKWENPSHSEGFTLNNSKTGIETVANFNANLFEYWDVADYGDATARYAEYLGVNSRV